MVRLYHGLQLGLTTGDDRSVMGWFMLDCLVNRAIVIRTSYVAVVAVVAVVEF